MPFSTQLNWFKVKPSILVFGILNTESRKTSSPTLPSSATWMGGDLHDYAVRPRSERAPNTKEKCPTPPRPRQVTSIYNLHSGLS